MMSFCFFALEERQDFAYPEAWNERTRAWLLPYLDALVMAGFFVELVAAAGLLLLSGILGYMSWSAKASLSNFAPAFDDAVCGIVTLLVLAFGVICEALRRRPLIHWIRQVKRLSSVPKGTYIRLWVDSAERFKYQNRVLIAITVAALVRNVWVIFG